MFKGCDFVRLVKAACKLLEFTSQTEFIEWGPRLFQFGLVRAHGTTFVQARSLRTLLQTVFSTPIKKTVFCSRSKKNLELGVLGSVPRIKGKQTPVTRFVLRTGVPEVFLKSRCVQIFFFSCRYSCSCFEM